MSNVHAHGCRNQKTPLWKDFISSSLAAQCKHTKSPGRDVAVRGLGPSAKPSDATKASHHGKPKCYGMDAMSIAPLRVLSAECRTKSAGAPMPRGSAG